MGTPVYKNQRDACYDEVYSTLMIYYFYKKRIVFLKKRGLAQTHEENIEDVVLLEALERGIVMGLCRLDDDSSGSFSFQRYCIELCKATKDQDRIKHITATKKAFRTTINPAKTKLRNRYIGHLAKAHDASYMKPEDFEPMIKQSVDTMDVLTGQKEEYIIRDKNSDFTLDLRGALSM